MALFGQGVAEMFKDVVPSADYGANTIDWSQVKPFQVINPMQGWVSQAPVGTKPAETAQPELSDYEKWLRQQSGMPSNNDRGGGVDKQEPGWYSTTTPAERAAFFAANPTMAAVSRFGMNAFNAINPYGLAKMQEQQTPGLLSGYLAETYGLPSDKYAEIAAQMAVNGQGGFMAGPAPNQDMSLADQYSQYGAGRAAAEAAVSGGGDSYSGAPGGEASGGSYAGGDFGYSGEGRGDYF